MKKDTKIVQKINHLLDKIDCPEWLHHFGPKTYKFVDHFLPLLIKQYCRLSYRRVVQLFDLLGIACPSKSALQYTSAKLGEKFWQKAISATCRTPHVAAIDGTGFSRTSPSYHYLRRIDGKIPSVPVKLSAIYDTRRKKFCGANVRVQPAHDIRDVKKLLRLCKPKVLVADKAYDAGWLHELCVEKGIKAHIPLRNWGKPRRGMLGARMLAAKHFRKRTYGRRELVEAGFGSLKRKFGSSVSSKKAKTIRSEIYGRILCQNLFSWLHRLLGQSRWKR